MTLGERLLTLRKNINLSQEEAAEKLNVTRQTISKWETDASTPDFDKIIPICNLYNITPDELLTGKKKEVIISTKKEHPFLLCLSIIIYFLSIVWTILGEETLFLNEGIVASVFLGLCGIATVLLVYYFITKPKEEKEETKPKNKNTLFNQISFIIRIIILTIYLLISFITMAWHITWILWIIYALIMEIVKLIFMLRGKNYEE